jgi:hypothetical protein
MPVGSYPSDDDDCYYWSGPVAVLMSIGPPTLTEAKHCKEE